MPPLPRPVITRLLQKLQKTDRGCWEWTGTKQAKRGGYGEMNAFGRMRSTHRLAWEIFRGPIPKGLMVLHRCDNPPCCNPDHLYLGTAKDNARDAVERGQITGGKCRGTQQPQAKLTEEIVRTIRSLPRSSFTLNGLAAQYNVSKKAILRVVRGDGWKHVSP